MSDPPSPGSCCPAAAPGFPCVPIDELLAPHADLIGRIKLCYGSDRESFEREVLTLIRRYAAYVHLLPATADNYFSQPGGLLRLGLETGFFSLQGTDAHIFSGKSTISVRRHLEPRWRHATFIAGLCCELHRVPSHFIVTDDNGALWPSYLEPLSVWLAAHRAPRYFLRWRPQATEARGLGVFTLPQVVPPEVLQHLSEDNTVIVPHLLASMGGIALHRDRNVLDELVRRSLALVIDRNLTAHAARHGSARIGTHLERYLVDALRRLVCNHSLWRPNRDKSLVWFGQDGLFLLWPAAAEDVFQLLEADQLPGIPKAHETMLELLLAAGVFAARDDARPTWTIRPPGAKTALEAVKLASPAVLLGGIEPPLLPLDQTLFEARVEPEQAVPLATPAASPAPGTQLPLIAPASPSPSKVQVTASADPPQPSAPRPASSTRTFALQAPLRLNPAVRDALAATVHTLNDQYGPAQCRTIAGGLFVPLNALLQRGVQPSLALRALAEARMLVRADADPTGLPTLTEDFDGTATAGFVIGPGFVTGLDQEGSRASAAGES